MDQKNFHADMISYTYLYSNYTAKGSMKPALKWLFYAILMFLFIYIKKTNM